jgi:hypothetical protein
MSNTVLLPPPLNPSLRRRYAGLFGSALGILGLALLQGPATAQSLTIGLANPVSSADPHISNTTSNFA